MVTLPGWIGRAPLLGAALALLLTACGGGGGSPGGPGTVVVDNPVTGGGGGGVPASLPSAASVQPTNGPLATGRYAHTATLLLDGRVLIAGGTTSGTTITDSAEVYVPAADAFSALASRMRYTRSNHTATRLLDGRVLLAGGWVETSHGVLQAQARAELFDPASNTFTEVGLMTHGRVDHAAVRLADGRVLLTGGSTLNGSFLADFDDAEVYDPATARFTALATPMAHTHATHVCLDLFDGRYFVAGGSDLDLRCELFTPAPQGFTPLAVAPADAPRFGACGAAFADGGAILAGGDASGTVLFLRPQTGVVQNTGSALTVPRTYATATRIGPEQVLVAGGVDFSNRGLLLASIDLVVEGGLGGAQCYGTPARFAVGMAAHTATLLASGRVLFCGGLVGDDAQSGRTDAFLFLP